MAVRDNPSPAFQVHRVRPLQVGPEGSNPVRLVFSLAKINLPAPYTMQGYDPFASHGKGVRVIRMENKREGRQSSGGHPSGRVRRSRTAPFIFLQVENPGPDFGDRNDVIVFSLFGGGDISRPPK